MSTKTPIMNIELPTPGPGGTVGPEWAQMLNTAVQTLDSHNHSTGKGAPVPTSSLNVDADIALSGKSVTGAKTTTYEPQSLPLAGATDKNAISSVAGDLYWNNGSGTAVKITSGSGINAASIGGIGGDYASSSASVSYSDTLKTFSFTQSSGVTAKMAVGDILIYENATGAKSITVKSPSALGSAYSLTLPAELPASTQPMSLSSSGAMSAAQIVTSQIADAQVTTAKIADANVTTVKIADSNVTTGKLADSGVTTAKINDSAVTTAKIADANVTTAKIADSNVTKAKLSSEVSTQIDTATSAVSSVTSMACGVEYVGPFSSNATGVYTAPGGRQIIGLFARVSGSGDFAMPGVSAVFPVSNAPDRSTTVTISGSTVNTSTTSGVASYQVYLTVFYKI